MSGWYKYAEAVGASYVVLSMVLDHFSFFCPNCKVVCIVYQCPLGGSKVCIFSNPNMGMGILCVSFRS